MLAALRRGSLVFGIVADLHGNFAALDWVMRAHPDIPFWLCVGDVASKDGRYPTPAAPLHFIKGNNEDFDQLEAFRAGHNLVTNLHFIPNGVVTTIGGLVVAGLGGTLAPTWYDTPAAVLPVRGRDDKRRHFVREEVEACIATAPVDVLLTHEAPTPFWVDLPSSSRPAGRWRRDVGKTAIAALADRLRPRLHCFGHHHVAQAFNRAGIPTVCVDRINRAYLLVDAVTFEFEARPTGA